MWDTKSRFTAQTSSWCGMATVSGTGFSSEVSSRASGSASGFRQNDPGLRKWQSLSHLAPEVPMRTFPPSPGAELRAARGASSFRQPEVGKWLQDAHERLENRLDRLTSRNSQLSYNITSTQLLDMKHKQLSEAMSALEQEKEAAELSQFEKSRQRGELHEKVIQLEKDLLQMRSTLDRGSNDRTTERRPGSPGGKLPMSQEDFNRQTVDSELCKLREALREAEARAKSQEEERNQALQKLQTSAETQKALLNQIEEMNQRFSHTKENHSEVQEQLSEANNKISEACLEKAILSTQVLKLEDEIKELKAKLTGALSEQQEKADLHQRVLELQKREQQGSEDCEVNEKLTQKLEMTKQELNAAQSQIQELTAERDVNSKQIAYLEAERSQLVKEKEELLSKMSESQQLTEMMGKCSQLSESVETLELEKVKLQDQLLCLEAAVHEKEEKLQLQEEEHQKQDAARGRSMEELKAVATHWTEKWQKVALTLQSTQEELEDLRKRNSTNELEAETVRLASEIQKLRREGQKDKEEIEKLLQHKANMETTLNTVKKENDLLLKAELDACKQELELERSRSQALLLRFKGAEASVQTQEKATVTDLSQSSLFWEPPADSQSSQNKLPQDQDDEEQALVSTTDSLRAQLEESRRRANLLQQEKTLAVQKLQIPRKLYPVTDEEPLSEGVKDKTIGPVNPETEQQRRMVTEQLKSLFKEREEKEAGKADDCSTAPQTESSLLQDWTGPTAKVMRGAGDWRCWRQGSGLMPVFEEDEESGDGPGEEGEGEPAEEAHAEMSAMRAEIICLKANNVNLLQDETDLQQVRPYSLYPDGIFLAELVDICSPDEDEEEVDNQ